MMYMYIVFHAIFQPVSSSTYGHMDMCTYKYHRLNLGMQYEAVLYIHTSYSVQISPMIHLHRHSFTGVKYTSSYNNIKVRQREVSQCGLVFTLE